jgi:3-isopropylmalate/(R)-2-methylmalate dehydratase small subunit
VARAAGLGPAGQPDPRDRGELRLRLQPGARPWALEDYGFRAIIAKSFADIFRSNCTKIGLLPVELAPGEVDAVAAAGHARVDLAAQEVRWEGGSARFDIDAQTKHRLLNGLDDIALTFQQGEAIDAYEADRERSGPVTTCLAGFSRRG